MRRILLNVVEGKEDLGDTSALADPSVVDTFYRSRPRPRGRDKPQRGRRGGGSFHPLSIRDIV